MEYMRFFSLHELNQMTTSELEEHMVQIDIYYKKMLNKLRERRAHDANLVTNKESA